MSIKLRKVIILIMVLTRFTLFLFKQIIRQTLFVAYFETTYKDMSRLRKTPKIGADLGNKTSIPNDYKYLVSGKYLIFYKVFEKEKVVRIYHIYYSREQYLVKLVLSDIEYDDD